MCNTSLIIREVQIDILMRYYLTPIRMATTIKTTTTTTNAGEVWVLILTCCNLHLPHSLDCVFQVRDHQERNVWAVWKADVTWCEMGSDGPGLVEAPACRCQLSQGSKRTSGSSGSKESWARCVTSNVGKGTPSRARNWALV